MQSQNKVNINVVYHCQEYHAGPGPRTNSIAMSFYHRQENHAETKANSAYCQEYHVSLQGQTNKCRFTIVIIL